MITFSSWIQIQMKLYKITVEELKDHCDVSRVSASKWVNGHNLPSVPAWHAIASLLSDRSGDPLSIVLSEMSDTIPLP